MGTSHRILVITPTYNEQESLRELVEHIRALAIADLEIQIVDDNSPDGTGALAEELASHYPVRVIHRANKEGLGKAYVHAFKEILALPPHLRPDYIIQMDADLSHNPADIPRFIEKIQSCDLVLGSRYIPGGSIEHWSWLRRLISRFGNIYASHMLGLPYRDLTSGYKCFRREILETIKLDALSSTGYNFQIETTLAAHKKGFRVCEIPIIFTERKFGSSKFNMRIIAESFWKVLMLRLK